MIVGLVKIGSEFLTTIQKHNLDTLEKKGCSMFKYGRMQIFSLSICLLQLKSFFTLNYYSNEIILVSKLSLR